MMDEKDAIALMANAIESTETVKNGKSNIDKETFDLMMTAIDSKLSTLDKSVTNLMELHKELQSLTHRVDQMELALKDAEATRANENNALLIGFEALRAEMKILTYRVEYLDAALNTSKKFRKRLNKISKKHSD